MDMDQIKITKIKEWVIPQTKRFWDKKECKTVHKEISQRIKK
jgi:hypothetical protein